MIEVKGTNYSQARRFTKTISFLQKYVSTDEPILDLGPKNSLGELMKSKGYKISYTGTENDLDDTITPVQNTDATVLTAFEIFEHLVSPYPLLKHAKADKLVASVPLKLWFTSAYWNENDPFDRHYHEFEPRQFNMLLEKAGWKIIDSEQWTSPIKKLGIRPILRRFTPRYYIVYCEREKS